jgi:uncharacterized RDD family membrane protein YckC
MTDRPQDPSRPTSSEPSIPPDPAPSSQAAPETSTASAPPPPPAPAPQHGGPSAPPVVPEYPPPAPPLGSHGPGNDVPAEPSSPPPPPNPYGGYSQAPVYAGGGGPASPGSLAYVEQNFGRVAGFGQRALAYLVDIALTMIGLIPVVLGIIMIAIAAPSDVDIDQFGNTTTSGDSNPALAAIGGLLIALGVLIAIGISIWNRVFKMGRTGQSVGKKVIGLYLLDDKTGQPVGAGMTFLREIVNGLVNQVLYIGWLWMLWDADKQTLGDKAVHSSVVNVPKS